MLIGCPSLQFIFFESPSELCKYQSSELSQVIPNLDPWSPELETYAEKERERERERDFEEEFVLMEHPLNETAIIDVFAPASFESNQNRALKSRSH